MNSTAPFGQLKVTSVIASNLNRVEKNLTQIDDNRRKKAVHDAMRFATICKTLKSEQTQKGNENGSEKSIPHS